MDHANAVRDFMIKHGQHLEGKPTIPPDDVVILRARLIMEEAAELVIALHERNLKEIADACADLEYVTAGTALACGIPHNEVFEEVHRSNMTKPALDARGKGGKVPSSGFTPPDIQVILDHWSKA